VKYSSQKTKSVCIRKAGEKQEQEQEKRPKKNKKKTKKSRKIPQLPVSWHEAGGFAAATWPLGRS